MTAQPPENTNDAKHDRPEVDTAPSIINVPNALCAIRLAGSFALVGIAVAENISLFFYVMIFLLMTDWIDGKLAILLDQRTVFGARLDSIADASLYTAVLFGAIWLEGDAVYGELPWILSAIASYAVTTGAGVLKFGRWPSYHTRAAKASWLLATVAAISLFAGWSLWPLRIAAIGVIITNLEATAITFILPDWRADVISFYHAWRDRKRR